MDRSTATVKVMQEGTPGTVVVLVEDLRRGLTLEEEDMEPKEAVVLNLERLAVLSPVAAVMGQGHRDLILEQALAEEEKEVMIMEELEVVACLLKQIVLEFLER